MQLETNETGAICVQDYLIIAEQKEKKEQKKKNGEF